MAREISYDSALRERVIKDFVLRTGYSPSKYQVISLLREYKLLYPRLSDLGFSGYNTETPKFRGEGSATIENTNRSSIETDLYTISGATSLITQRLNDSAIGFDVTAHRCMKLLHQLDSRLNNLLLLSGRTDAFVYGIEETFDTQEYIDFANTTASVQPGYVTLGRKGFTKLSLDNAKITYSASAERGVLSARSIGNIDSLKNIDGNIWEYHIDTVNHMGRVSCLISIDFDTEAGEYIGDVRLIGNPINTNTKTSITLLYSIDGHTFSVLKPAEQAMVKGENQFSVGIEGIKKIRLLLSKDGADEMSGDKSIYIFSFDCLEIFTDRFTPQTRSVLIAGPYEVLDENGADVNFSMATLQHDTCCVVPEETSVNFYLSKDGEVWFPVSYREKSLSTVAFNTTSPEGTETFIDDSQADSTLITTVPLGVDYRFGREAFLNKYISDTYSDKLVTQSIIVKRNLPQAGQSFYGVASGWRFDANTKQYSCVISIDRLEGRYLDLGNTSAYIDGRLLSGSIYLAKGLHTFSTSYTNWREVSSGINNVTDLQLADPNYPYNHKLLIEGYSYPSGFQGTQIYLGVDEYFAYQLRYVTPEIFNDPDSDSDLSIYTFENYNEDIYFKVKIDPSDPSYQTELVELSYNLRMSDSNTLYVKAILETHSERTPNIKSFKVRVI